MKHVREISSLFPATHSNYSNHLWEIWGERQSQYIKWGVPAEEAVGLAYIQCLHRLVLDRYPQVIHEMEGIMCSSFN